MSEASGAALDHGPDGQAFRARPSTLALVGRTYGGAADREGEAVEARRMLDATRWDRMHLAGQLNDRQHRVAEQLAGWYPRAQTTGNYGAPRGAILSAEEGEDGEEALQPRDRYRKAVGTLPSRIASLVDSLMEGQGPGWYLPELQCGLDKLADCWGWPREIA